MESINSTPTSLWLCLFPAHRSKVTRGDLRRNDQTGQSQETTLPQAAHTDIRILTHTRNTCTGSRMFTPAQDTCTHSTGLWLWLSPGTSLVLSAPFCLSPLSAFWLAFRVSVRWQCGGKDRVFTSLFLQKELVSNKPCYSG